MARRNQHTLAQLEVLIIDAAELILRHDGVKALTVRRVALEIGYTVGSLYMVFESMECLIARLKQRAWERLSQALTMVSANETNEITAFLRAWAEAYWHFAQQERHAFLMLFEQRGGANDWCDAARRDALSSPLAAVLRRHHPGLTSDAALYAARAYWCAVHGACHLALTDRLSSADTVTLLNHYAACFSACEVFVPDAANCQR